MSTNTPKPLLYQGRRYASKGELMRMTGLSWNGVACRLRSGEIALAAGPAPGPLPRRPARTVVPGSGPEAGAARILEAARTIRAIARAQDADALYHDATRVELLARRASLVKALHLFRRRWGVGVTEVKA